MELKGISYSDREFGSQPNLSGMDKVRENYHLHIYEIKTFYQNVT